MAEFLQGLLAGKNMSSEDSVRYLFRGLSLLKVAWKDQESTTYSSKPARISLTFPSRHHAEAAHRWASPPQPTSVL